EYFIGRLHSSKGKVHDFLKRRVKSAHSEKETP
ncbi:YihY/virulence factor BrkB family protein, partial [Lactobacillus rhamnosus]|nr:YihY/virulence factor BrkB family protein [Lacticaseibacillus rhamnosus]